ncbi:MAG: hypothetical protein WC865_12460 [Bacteroidales bacterium]
MNNAPKKITKPTYYLTMQAAGAVLVLIWLTGIISIYAVLKFVQYFIQMDLTLENFFFPSNNTQNQFPLHRMSPTTGARDFTAGGISHPRRS